MIMALNVQDNKFILPVEIAAAGKVTKELQTAGTYVDKNIKIEVNTPDGSLEVKKEGTLSASVSVDTNVYTSDTETKYPITVKEDWMYINAQYMTFQYESKIVGIVNVHLPWDSVIMREKYITNIVSKLDDKKCDYIFVLGDFNSGDNSDVVRMIMGDCSLNGTEANPCFYDLALASAQMRGAPANNTLDFSNNPRFCENTIEINQRFDRIFLRNTYPLKFPKLITCDVFGTKVYSEINLSASDHYGVYAVIESE